MLLSSIKFHGGLHSCHKTSETNHKANPMKLDLDNFWVKLLVFSVWAAVVWLIYSIIPSIGTRLPSPQVTIENATPCLIEDGKRISVENFEEGTSQYICGEMTTDTSPVNLTLLIYPSDIFIKSLYATSANFTQGAISFSINPPLPSGKYRALVMYARTTFADIYFDVNQK